MAVRFHTRSTSNSLVPVLQFSIGTKRLVHLCPDVESHRSKWLHWDHELGKTVPCTEDGSCPYCPRAVREVTYVPAVEWIASARRWLRRIAPVTDTGVHVFDSDLAKLSWSVCRYGRKTSPVVWTAQDLAESRPTVVPFEIETSLSRMWGCQRTVDDPARIR